MRKKTKIKPTKKRGRPFGSKNKKKRLPKEFNNGTVTIDNIINYDNIINSETINVLKKSLINLADGLKNVVISFFDVIKK